MKYFVVADVHGFYDEMKEALDAAGFNPETDTLISCGDAIDRGPRPNEVIKYFTNLPNKILIRGNHEDLMEDLMNNPWGPHMHDHSNGTYNTLIELASKHHKVNYGTKISKSLAQYTEWEDLSRWARAEKTYRRYTEMLVDYAEIGQYIFVHGWIPCVCKMDLNGGKWERTHEYMKNWREFSTVDCWKDARWTSGIECTVQRVFEPGKKIVCGHWHAAAWHTVYEDKPSMSDHSIYEDKWVVALDTCTVVSKKVNVFVFESDEEVKVGKAE